MLSLELLNGIVYENRVMKLIAFVIGLLAQAVPVGVFFLKFLNWWHSDEHTAATSAITHLPVPPAPEPLQVWFKCK
jgi:hypothetical protein